MRKAVYGEDSRHPHIAIAYNGLAKTYHRLGDNTEALENCERSSEILRTIDDADTKHSVIIAARYKIIGDVHYSLGKPLTAYEYHEMAFKLRKVIYKESRNHPEMVESCNDMAKY